MAAQTARKSAERSCAALARLIGMESGDHAPSLTLTNFNRDDRDGIDWMSEKANRESKIFLCSLPRQNLGNGFSFFTVPIIDRRRAALRRPI